MSQDGPGRPEIEEIQGFLEGGKAGRPKKDERRAGVRMAACLQSPRDWARLSSPQQVPGGADKQALPWPKGPQHFGGPSCRASAHTSQPQPPTKS